MTVARQNTGVAVGFDHVPIRISNFLCFRQPIRILAAAAAAIADTRTLLGMVTMWILQADGSATRHTHAFRPALQSKSRNIATQLQRVLQPCPISQRSGVFHDCRPVERFCAKVCNVVLTLDTAQLQSVGSAFILNPKMNQIFVFQSTDSLSVENVFRVVCVDHWHCFQHIAEITQQRQFHRLYDVAESNVGGCFGLKLLDIKLTGFDFAITGSSPVLLPRALLDMVFGF